MSGTLIYGATQSDVRKAT